MKRVWQDPSLLYIASAEPMPQREFCQGIRRLKVTIVFRLKLDEDPKKAFTRIWPNLRS